MDWIFPSSEREIVTVLSNLSTIVISCPSELKVYLIFSGVSNIKVPLVPFVSFIRDVPHVYEPFSYVKSIGLLPGKVTTFKFSDGSF